MAEFLTPPKQGIVSRKDFMTPATILQFHIRGRHRGVRRCESGKPVSVPHRGSVNMSRVVPAGADTAASANDPTLGCRRNRVPSPLQNRQPSAHSLTCGVLAKRFTHKWHATRQHRTCQPNPPRCIPMSMPDDHTWSPKRPPASCVGTAPHVLTPNN